MERTLEECVGAAHSGNMNALEVVVTSIQDRIYGIAMRMLAQAAIRHPEAAV